MSWHDITIPNVDHDCEHSCSSFRKLHETARGFAPVKVTLNTFYTHVKEFIKSMYRAMIKKLNY